MSALRLFSWVHIGHQLPRLEQTGSRRPKAFKEQPPSDPRSPLLRQSSPERAKIPTLWIGGLPISAINRHRSARMIIDTAQDRRGTGRPPLFVTSANGQVVSICWRDKDVKQSFVLADIIHADGMSLVFASQLKCAPPLPERVATTDLFHDVARLAEREGATFYFLGSTKPVLEEAVQRVRQLYPRLVVVGSRDGYFNPEEEEAVVAEINAAQPDVLWVGMGVPREQSFIALHYERLNRVGVIKTAGGLFDFLSGRNRRAPRWMQLACLEWLHRLWLEPRRLLWRYLSTNPHALYLLWAHTLKDAFGDSETQIERKLK
jgi:N-acetylglucosaminyldiphosphoundecaprenol N-acetyl-beta-D-mannosaminyltransferase